MSSESNSSRSSGGNDDSLNGSTMASSVSISIHDEFNATRSPNSITNDEGNELTSLRNKGAGSLKRGESKSKTMSGFTKRGIVVPITVKFDDVVYKVDLPPSGDLFNFSSVLSQPSSLLPFSSAGLAKKENSKKTILHGVTGCVLPGEVLAMMGPSGSGKTSFLNVLGGRVNLSNVSGKLTYNDLPFSKALKNKIGFVTQDDIFYAHLTVRETLMYAAILRLPQSMSRAEKVLRADEVIEELGLEKCKDTVIGNQFLRGISGGERKRVSIGHEILIDPSLLLLDEPTSGLDSTTALRIVHVLENMAKSGRTVVTTIHQPSSRLFHSFDKLLLLSEGNSIYFGKASDAMAYFSSLSFRPLFAVNPADFLLDLATGTVSDVETPSHFAGNGEWESKGAAEQKAEVTKYLAVVHREHVLNQVAPLLAALPEASESERNALMQKRNFVAPWREQFEVLWTRGFKERRSEALSPLKFYQIIAIALICGSLWFNSSLKSPAKVQDQLGLIFFMSTFWGFFPLFASIFAFPQERSMLMKERASDMYRLSAYFMSRTLSDLPMDYVLPTIFMLICYFMANLSQTFGGFVATWLSILLLVTVAQGLGFLLGAAVMDVKKATVMASVIVLTFMLAGGYFLQHTPEWIGWVKYISFTWYSYRLILKSQYSEDQMYPCHVSDSGSTLQQSGSMSLTNDGTELNGVCRLQDAPALRNTKLTDAWVDVLALLAQVVVYRLLAYVALRRMKLGAK